MRLAFLACVGFCFVPILAAQWSPDETSPYQCLGGTLLSVRQDSITVKFNEKIITTRLAPGAEIWRRGVDLDSLQQLVPGDSIYMKCARASDGALVAAVVAAVEKDDGVELVPHHIVEIRVCIGRLVASTNDTLSLKNDRGICVIHTTPETKFWRGEIFNHHSAFQLGDEVSARVAVNYPGGELIADGQVEANVAKAEGTIVSVKPDRITVKEDRVRGYATVLLGPHTSIDLNLGPMKRGAYVMAIGLDLGKHTLQATSISIEK